MLTQDDQTAVLIPTMPFRQLKIADYIDRAKKRKLFKDEYIIARAEGIDDLYYFYVEKGQLKCDFTKMDGQPATLFYRNAGNAFSAEYGGIASVGNYKMRYVATTDTIVFGFTQHQLWEIIAVDPDIFYEFVFVCHMSFGQMGHRISTTSTASSMKRIVFWLHKLCAGRNPEEDGSYRIDAHISNQQLAELLNIHPTTCSRLLGALEADGVISRTKNEFIVNDLARLASYEE